MIVPLIAFVVTFGLAWEVGRQRQRYERERALRIVAELNANALLRAIYGTQPYFACPVCMAVSYSLGDLEHGYCGRCHQVTREPYQVDFPIEQTGRG